MNEQRQKWKEYLILLAAWHTEMAIYLHDLTKWYAKYGVVSTQDDDDDDDGPGSNPIPQPPSPPPPPGLPPKP